MNCNVFCYGLSYISIARRDINLSNLRNGIQILIFYILFSSKFSESSFARWVFQEVCKQTTSKMAERTRSRDALELICISCSSRDRLIERFDVSSGGRQFCVCLCNASATLCNIPYLSLRLKRCDFEVSILKQILYMQIRKTSRAPCSLERANILSSLGLEFKYLMLVMVSDMIRAALCYVWSVVMWRSLWLCGVRCGYVTFVVVMWRSVW